MSKPHFLSVTALVLLSVNAVLNIRSLPLFAHIGLQALGFYLLATVAFLIPSSLASAELAARVGAAGGVYGWVRAAFGEKVGFLAIWLEWINNVIGFPATLSTISATLLFFVVPDVTQHRWLFFAVMMGILWSLTAVNLRGIKAAARLTSVGSVCGTVLPGLLVITFGMLWVMWGKPIGFLAHPTSIFPPVAFSSLSMWVGVMGALSGMQIAGFHLPNIQDPQRAFPKVMGISVLLIVLLSLGSIFAMSTVVSPRELNLLSGVIQMYQVFFHSVGWDWVLGVFVVLLSLGMMSSMSAWMLGPARGLQFAAQEQLLPRWFERMNRRHVPRNILLLQSGVASVLALSFVLMPSFQEVFWMLTALMGQFTVLMYVLIFSSLFVLRTQAVKRNEPSLRFVIPGGRWGVGLVAALGLISCGVAFVVGIFPPSQLGISGTAFVVRMVLIDGVILLFPFVVNALRKR